MKISEQVQLRREANQTLIGIIELACNSIENCEDVDQKTFIEYSAITRKIINIIKERSLECENISDVIGDLRRDEEKDEGIRAMLKPAFSFK